MLAETEANVHRNESMLATMKGGICIMKKKTLCSLLAVSYIHLDVYKRQAICFSECDTDTLIHIQEGTPVS